MAGQKPGHPTAADPVTGPLDRGDRVWKADLAADHSANIAYCHGQRADLVGSGRRRKGKGAVAERGYRAEARVLTDQPSVAVEAPDVGDTSDGVGNAGGQVPTGPAPAWQ